MEPLLQPITALRVLTLTVTILLIAVLFLVLPKGSLAASFLLGAAIGLSIGVQTMVWNKKMDWQDKGSRQE
jgi:inner membrane protein involved in colicin E2 resistance